MLCEGYFDKQSYAHKLIQKHQIKGYCSKDFPLPDKIESIEDLFPLRLFIREQGSGTREIFERELTRHGYPLQSFPYRSSISSPLIIVELLLNCLGISFLYDSVCEQYVKAGLLQEIAIPDFTLSHEYNAIWSKNTMFHEKYLNYIQELLAL